MSHKGIFTGGLLLAALILAGCEGHQYEPRKPGITLSGEAGAGVVYKNGTAAPHSETKLKVSMGGSI
ncbi:hypothetical protein [Aliiroseovarius marinus]|uniref:hypothetical protein n=1 Tax=Aliiroseovarius marinus TaxID=2500159 RepID=UPI003D7E5CD0